MLNNLLMDVVGPSIDINPGAVTVIAAAVIVAVTVAVIIRAVNKKNKDNKDQ